MGDRRRWVSSIWACVASNLARDVGAFPDGRLQERGREAGSWMWEPEELSLSCRSQEGRAERGEVWECRMGLDKMGRPV
ncbi:hypothetical protein AAC387_Pa06g2328 [Persea americana]